MSAPSPSNPHRAGPLFAALLAALLTVSLNACGSGAEEATLTGTFADSPVAGLGVVGTTTPAGTTDALGTLAAAAIVFANPVSGL